MQLPADPQRAKEGVEAAGQVWRLAQPLIADDIADTEKAGTQLFNGVVIAIGEPPDDRLVVCLVACQQDRPSIAQQFEGAAIGYGLQPMTLEIEVANDFGAHKPERI